MIPARPLVLRAALLLLALGLGACGGTRAEGDAGGRPVAFHVTIERAFLSAMGRQRPATGVGVGTGFSSTGASGVGVGLGIGFSSTRVYLLGGDEAGQAGAFRKELSWGDTDFTIPLKPGRRLALTVQCEGGRQGWEGVGVITIPTAEGQARVRVALLAAGASIDVTPAPAAVPPPATTGGTTP